MNNHITPNTLSSDKTTKLPKTTLADVNLLTGHWKGDFLGGMAEEIWLPPAGGTMLGVFRLCKNNQILFYEIMIMVEEEDSISLKLKHFHPDLKGWEENDGSVTFRLIKVGKDAIWFDGLTYYKEEGSLRGFIAILQKDGNVIEESFILQAVQPN